MKTHPRRTAVLGACAFAAGLMLPAVTSADHSWGNYHWARTSNPFTLKLGDNLSSTWDPYLATTSADWSASSVLNTVIVPGSTKARPCRAPAGRVEVCATTYGNNGWLGLASISVSGDHITAGTVKLNDTYFNTPTYNTVAWRNLVMCQEVGHAFGLDHQDETFDNPNLGTCMDYTSNPETNQHPNAHDYNQLEAIYAHLDSSTTVGQSAPGASAQGNGRGAEYGTAQWGRLIRSGNGGRTEHYELDLGNGNKVHTFVIWAE